MCVRSNRICVCTRIDSKLLYLYTFKTFKREFVWIEMKKSKILNVVHDIHKK